MLGSQHNDVFYKHNNNNNNNNNNKKNPPKFNYNGYISSVLRTKTNNSGGIQGGISNGEDIVFRVAFKPPATIGKQQYTVDFQGVCVCVCSYVC